MPSEKTYAREVGFEVCAIDENGLFTRGHWHHSLAWRNAGEQEGFAGWDWELPDGRMIEGLDHKVIWWSEKAQEWTEDKRVSDDIPLTTPRAVRFLKETKDAPSH